MSEYSERSLPTPADKKQVSNDTFAPPKLLTLMPFVLSLNTQV